MNTDALPLDSDAIRLIAEIGFMGSQTGQPVAARTIFEQLLLLRPESTMPYVGLAMAMLASGKPDEAARILRDEGVKKFPADGQLMAFLGMALHGAGRNAEATQVLAAAIKMPGENSEPYVRLATQLLAAINAGGGNTRQPAPKAVEPALMAGPAGAA